MHASAAGSAAGGSAAVVVNDGANATAIRDVVTTALDLNVKAVAAAAPPQFVSIKSYLDGWFKLNPVVSPGHVGFSVRSRKNRVCFRSESR